MEQVIAKTIQLDADLLVAEYEKEEPNHARISYILLNLRAHVTDLQVRLGNQGVDVHDAL